MSGGPTHNHTINLLNLEATKSLNNWLNTLSFANGKNVINRIFYDRLWAKFEAHNLIGEAHKSPLVKKYCSWYHFEM